MFIVAMAALAALDTIAAVRDSRQGVRMEHLKRAWKLVFAACAGEEVDPDEACQILDDAKWTMGVFEARCRNWEKRSAEMKLAATLPALEAKKAKVQAEQMKLRAEYKRELDRWRKLLGDIDEQRSIVEQQISLADGAKRRCYRDYVEHVPRGRQQRVEKVDADSPPSMDPLPWIAEELKPLRAKRAELGRERSNIAEQIGEVHGYPLIANHRTEQARLEKELLEVDKKRNNPAWAPRYAAYERDLKRWKASGKEIERLKAREREIVEKLIPAVQRDIDKVLDKTLQLPEMDDL